MADQITDQDGKVTIAAKTCGGMVLDTLTTTGSRGGGSVKTYYRITGKRAWHACKVWAVRYSDEWTVNERCEKVPRQD